MIKNNTLIININNDNYNKIIKKTRRYIKLCDKKNLKFKYETDLNKEELKDIEKAINIKDKKERIEFIYDKICLDLDKKINTNYCEFENDICIKYRYKNSNHKNGCCECKGRGKCKYLIGSTCTMKTCMACKLFTCKTLRKKGIKHNINDYIIGKYFFTRKQKDILRYSFWTPKEIVIDRLLKNKYIKP